MKFRDTMKVLGTASVYFFAIIFIIAVTIGAVHTCNKPVEELPFPVKRNEVIDSLTTTNQIILIKVNELDSIKDVEILKAKSLSNDSTLELFYELIRKE